MHVAPAVQASVVAMPAWQVQTPDLSKAQIPPAPCIGPHGCTQCVIDAQASVLPPGSQGESVSHEVIAQVLMTPTTAIGLLNVHSPGSRGVKEIVARMQSAQAGVTLLVIIVQREVQ